MVAYTVKIVKIAKFLKRISGTSNSELEAVGHFLVRKLKWGDHGPPGSPPVATPLLVRQVETLPHRIAR